MPISQFFKVAAAASLDFYIFEILTVETLKRAKLRQHAKFFGDRSKRRFSRYGDFSISQEGG